jgi:hypothetical protein
VVNTIAGHGKLAYAGDGKAATSVNLFAPKRVAFDRAGNLYFTEGSYNRVFKVSAKYAGAAPNMVAGVYQINVRVPDAAPTGDRVPIVVKSGTASSPATVTVSLK